MKRRMAELADQQKIQDMIAHQVPFEEILGAITEMVARQMPESVVSFMMYDPSDNTLSLVAGQGVSETYRQAMQRVVIGPNVASCGKTAFTREVVITPNIEHEPDWAPFAHLARAESLKSCWSVPVLTPGNDLLGTFAVYGRYPSEPASEDLVLMYRASGLLALATARERDRKALQDHEQRYRRLLYQHENTLSELRFQETHDPLTRLPNRTSFEALLNEHCCSNGDRLVGLLVNLDGFTTINEGLGHTVGDQLLQAVAGRLRSELPKEAFLARLGGDEFGILLGTRSEYTDELPLKTADTVLALLSRPFVVGEHTVHISASIGIASGSDGCEGNCVLMAHAHTAVREAKNQGRNTWEWYAGEQDSSIREHVAIRRELLEAIEGDQFVVHYQPLVDAATTEIRGVEALVRWQHPERGLVPPGLFIPVAEATGQIIDIGRCVLRQACHDMKQIVEHLGRPITLAVNISPVHFRRSSFFSEIQGVLEDSGLSPSCLELEVTEGVLMSAAEKALEQVQALRNLGVKVAIDDFGTGFSSLSYLRDLPINKVKIDRSFINDIDTSRHNAAIVKGVITMTHHLGLEVVAEGVETEAQHEYLRAHGCDLLQGFYFSRPVPLKELLQ